MKKIFNARILALILITAVVLVPILSQTVASASADSYKNYDLSNPSSSSNTVIDAEYFVNLLGGSGVVSDVEREYLRDVYSYISVKYDEPTADNITISALNDTVTVIAETYSYKTSGGITVFWNPVSVTVDGTDATANFTVNGGEYVASIAGVSITDHSKVVVKYVMDRSFEIDKDDLNSAFNYTFNEAEKIKADYIAAENSYNELKKVYDEKLDEYEKWLNRTEEEKAAEWAAYDKYLDDLAIYQEKLVSYNEYLKQLKEYQDQVDAYNAYLVARDEYNYF